MEPEVFARFLQLLSADPEEAGRRYTSLQKKLIGYFRLKGVDDPVSLADEVIDRAIMKITGGADVPHVDRFCLGIARRVYKETVRLRQRETSAFQQFIAELGDSSVDQVDRIYNLLQPCFEQLANDEQQLLLAYCHESQGRSRIEYRHQLAEKMQLTVMTLRARVSRLRNKLTDCVEKRAKSTMSISN